jgi:hypothetical protein
MRNEQGRNTFSKERSNESSVRHGEFTEQRTPEDSEAQGYTRGSHSRKERRHTETIGDEQSWGF